MSNLESIPVITIGQNDIKCVTTIIIYDQLKWKTHIDKQCKKISGNIALLKRARPFLPMHSRLKMFNDNSLMNLTFLCLWNFILFVQYKSKQNKLKKYCHTRPDFVFNAYIIIYAGSVFLGTPCSSKIDLIC